MHIAEGTFFNRENLDVWPPKPPFLFKFQFVENDGLPDVVCSKCLLQLSRIQAFRQLAFQSNFILRRKVKYVQVKEAKEEKCANDGSFVYLIQQRSDQDENDTEEYTMAVEQEHEIDEEAGMGDLIEIVEYAEEDYNPSESSNNEPRSGEDSEEDAEYIERIDEPAEEGAPVQRRRRNPEDSTRKTECEICGKMLSNNSSLKYHMQLHSDKTPFECPKCREKFKTRNAYDGHMTTHMENPNKCDICGKTYRQAASLRSHMLKHENKKPFVCEICGKGMTQKSGYKKHMLLHTGDKPHSCDFCEKTFRYKSNLLCHRRTHSNERNYPCDVSDQVNVISHSPSSFPTFSFCTAMRQEISRKRAAQAPQSHPHRRKAIQMQSMPQMFQQKRNSPGKPNVNNSIYEDE